MLGRLARGDAARGALNSVLRWSNDVKIKRILALAGVLTLLAGAALAQVSFPAGAGVGVYRTPPGSHVGAAINPRPRAAQPSRADANRQAVSKSCSQQADAAGLHGKARRSFREKCKKSGGR
jgi:hypothetical protein